ncbi:hypothetical protein [Psychrobacter sp.]|uniref:hypothetical protein n=1 Tax=Psychrobacter sp. TaxID=56811 RepID=UPI0025D0B0BE|nr:hypothetical protein [Psychrobacter sp.]
MTQPLIEKLQHLDSILHDIRQRYDNSNNELFALKQTPSLDIQAIEQLQQQLEETQDAYERVLTEHQHLQQQVSQLDQEYQTLAEAHNGLTEEYNDLLKKCEALEQANHTLLEKNRLAKEHTKVVMQRLTLIDQAVD